MTEVLMIGLVFLMMYFIGNDIICFAMNCRMKNKTIKYKKNRTLQVKYAYFKSFKEVELVINYFGIGSIIKCKYEDIEII